jgi:hypothetical protein
MLDDMIDPPAPMSPGSILTSTVINEYEKATLTEVVKILKGYLRVLIMLQQFRVAFLAFFTHYPELFGEQDSDGPFG